MDHLAKNEEVLKILGSKLDKRYKKAIINSADKSLIRAICELSLNLLSGNIELDKHSFEELKKYKKVLRKLVSKQKSKSLSTKKRLIIQNGGFLQFLIPAVIGGISTIIGDLISRNTSQ